MFFFFAESKTNFNFSLFILWMFFQRKIERKETRKNVFSPFDNYIFRNLPIVSFDFELKKKTKTTKKRTNDDVQQFELK